MANSFTNSPEDLIVWPCGTYCERNDLYQYDWLSDDYTVLAEGTEPWFAFCLENDLIDVIPANDIHYTPSNSCWLEDNRYA